MQKQITFFFFEISDMISSQSADFSLCLSFENRILLISVLFLSRIKHTHNIEKCMSFLLGVIFGASPVVLSRRIAHFKCAVMQTRLTK